MDSLMKCVKCGLVNSEMELEVLFTNGLMGKVCQPCFDATNSADKRRLALPPALLALPATFAQT